MRREELIKEIDSLIQDSENIIGSFIYHKCMDYMKKGLSEEKYNNLKNEFEKFKKIDFSEQYQKWFSKCLSLIQIIMPARKSEFEQLYLPKSNRKDLSLLNYTIFDAIRGIHNESKKITVDSAYQLIITQIDILKSMKDIVEDRLNEIQNLLEFDVFEKEIDSARYLLKNKYLRSAGAICGVIIEKHLINMLSNANLTPSKKNPSINDLKDDLYNHSLIDTTQNKFLLFLADIRNKCDHNKKTDPTETEIADLIDGTEKVIKTY